MPSVINASANGLITSGDTTGTLNIQVGGNTALTLKSDKSLTLAGSGITKSIFETVTISATAATGTINVDILNSVVWYYTTNASANWVFNFRGNSTTSLNTAMTTGQSATVAFLVEQGANAYYSTTITIDGVANTVVWQGGYVPTFATPNTLDVYVYTIIKTSSATFKVLGQRITYSS